MKHKDKLRLASMLIACGTVTAFTNADDIQLGDPGITTDHTGAEYFTSADPEVEMSIRGEVNWALDSHFTTSKWDISGGLYQPTVPGFGAPTLEPYGDVLGYTGAGVGDVDGDGYGDFALTWYNADTQLDFFGTPKTGECRPHFDHHSEYVGMVRIMSGNPNYAKPTTYQDTNTNKSDDRKSTFNKTGASTYDSNVRRIGGDFWGFRTNSLWSHEINAIGDIDGDGRDDILLSANGYSSPTDPFEEHAGLVEIWSFTSEYNIDGSTQERWIKLVEIKGIASTTEKHEMGYQSHHGPVPRNDDGILASDGFDLDFNNDGQQDLLIASKFYRDSGNGHFVGTGAPTVDREYSPGAAWIYLLPKVEVFQHIKDQANPKDLDCNTWVLSTPSGSDNISDLLPLQYDSDEFSIKIVGHQGYKSATNAAPTVSSTQYPRHFGMQVDPAGDVDGDGNLDLVVSAPFHKRNHNSDSNDNETTVTPSVYGEYSYEEGDALENGTHVGSVYIFLSDSDNAQRASDTLEPDTSFADLDPKFYLAPRLIGQGLTPIGSGTPGILYNLKKLDMSMNQIAFTSQGADFVFTGIQNDGYDNFTQAVGSSIEAGINLNGNSDPDLVIHNRKRARTEIITDLNSKLEATFGVDGNNVVNKPTVMTEIWDSERGTSTAYIGPLSVSPDIEHIQEDDSYAIASGNDLTYTSMGTPKFQQFGIGPLTTNAGIGGARIAGNYDGDGNGDCELFLHTRVNINGFCAPGCVETNTTSDGALAVDLHATPGITIIDRFLPEQTNLCTDNFDTKLNKNRIHVSSESISLWPVWSSPYDPPQNMAGDDDRDDALVGVRGYPRRALNYPDSDPGVGLPSFWYPIDYGTVTGCTLNDRSVMPAGKAYLVRTPLQVQE